MSALVTAKNIRKEPKSNNEPCFPEYDEGRLIRIVDKGLSIPEDMKQWRDPKTSYVGLQSYSPLQQIDGQSSRQDHCRDRVVGGLLEQKMGLNTSTVALVVDGEFKTLLQNIAQEDISRFRNLALFPCVWHDMKHLMENIAKDSVNKILLMDPFHVECIRMQDEKKRKQSEEILCDMNSLVGLKRVVSHEPRSPRTTMKVTALSQSRGKQTRVWHRRNDGASWWR